MTRKDENHGCLGTTALLQDFFVPKLIYYRFFGYSFPLDNLQVILLLFISLFKSGLSSETFLAREGCILKTRLISIKG